MRADDHGHAALDDTSFFQGDFAQSLAQILLMVDRHGRDDRQRRVIHHIGRIQPPTQAHFQQGVIGRGAGKGQQSGTGGDFKKRDLTRAVLLHAFVQKVREGGFQDDLSCQSNALVKPCQMGRGIGMNAGPTRL